MFRISISLVTFWPPHSPDLNPLDYSFWGQCETKLYDTEINSIDDVKAVVNEIIENFSEADVRRMCQNIRKRANLCLLQNGGHFEHLLKIHDFNI